MSDGPSATIGKVARRSRIARQKGLGWRGRVGPNELLALELRPKVRGGGMAEGGYVPFDLRPRNRAWNDRGDDRMSEREVQRRGGKRNTMARADRLDLSHPLQDLGASRRVIVHCAGNGAGRENSGIVAPANDDPDAPLLAARKLALEHVLLARRVAQGQAEKTPAETV